VPPLVTQNTPSRVNKVPKNKLSTFYEVPVNEPSFFYEFPMNKVPTLQTPDFTLDPAAVLQMIQQEEKQNETLYEKFEVTIALLLIRQEFPQSLSFHIS
jgi:hypothetical protein